MGSDVLHERDERGHLAGFTKRHAMPVAEVVIVDPDRQNRSAFTHRLAAQGFALRATKVSALDAKGGAYMGHLRRYTRGHPRSCTKDGQGHE